MLHDADWYRLRYFNTLEEAEALIERWRRGVRQSRNERDAVWVWASETVHRLSRNHYKRQQNTSRWQWWQLHGIEAEHDAHNERAIALLGMLTAPQHANRSAVWVIAAYRRRFAQIEALHQLRDLGVGMTDDGQKLHEQSIPVITWVYCSKLERNIEARGLDITNDSIYDEWVRTEKHYKRSPSDRRYANFLRKYAWYQELRELAHRKPYQPDDTPELHTNKARR